MFMVNNVEVRLTESMKVMSNGLKIADLNYILV